MIKGRLICYDKLIEDLQNNARKSYLGSTSFEELSVGEVLSVISEQPIINASEVLRSEWITEINKTDIKMAITQLKNDKRFIAEINLNKLMAYDLAISVMQKLLEQK